MVELGQLEQRYSEFAQRKVRIVAISNDSQATAKLTQAVVPHLTVVADTQQTIARAMQVIHPGAGEKGSDTNAPTLFLVDGAGKVRWLYRPDRFTDRLPADQVLDAIADR